MLSPDGRHLAFNSDRLGYYEIHVAGADGSNQVALTSMGPTAMGSPRWSPDSQRIAFDRYENGHSMIYTIGAEGGKPRRVTDDRFRDIRPSFSRDGKWIYFSSNRGGRIEIWKVPAGGRYAATDHAQFRNRAVRIARRQAAVLHERPGTLGAAGGGRRSQAGARGSRFFSCTRWPGAAFIMACGIRRACGYCAPIPAGSSNMCAFPREGIGFDGGTVFSVSADERTIFFSQTDRQESDLMLVEHFR